MVYLLSFANATATQSMLPVWRVHATLFSVYMHQFNTQANRRTIYLYGGERGGETETKTDTDRQTVTDTEKQRQRETKRQGQRYRERDREGERERERQRERQTDTGRDRDRETEKQPVYCRCEEEGG